MPDRNQGIINYGSIGGNASVTSNVTRIGDNVGAAAVNRANVNATPSLSELTQALVRSTSDADASKQVVSQIQAMQAVLLALGKTSSKSNSGVSVALDETIKAASADKPDKKSIELSAKGLVEAAKGVAEVLPIAIKITGLIAGLFGIAI